MFAVPWWVYLVISGIIFSAYMTIRTARNEREIDNSYLEQEGQVYIERMNSEKQGRKENVKKHQAM
ncbi:sporulation YhaL family protein [Cytobacillus sp. S13-E01]|uniref:sporulation YhaL family protein n=1 Tax=Cytobacillus sp. S13-E01 TaxID=3031326 RepID=UPI0023D88FF7|nr:sporulation YhaL family protein [Cytobacillus sp. S13-E01]MDF0726902.1 sporulation YhaL family protein [Cytobacillus sp. S13-E01]